mgnify:CR=1 FL=1
MSKRTHKLPLALVALILALLAALTIGKLRILGLDGEHGVAKTAQAALNRGYEVELVADGIATARPGAFETVRAALGGQGARVV